MNKEQIKFNDIKKLYQILQAVESYENNSVDLYNTFITIGDLSGGSIAVNWNDKECYYIRNKYGYIQRGGGALCDPNKDGIYFEKLYNLGIVLKSDLRDEFNKEKAFFESELIFLKGKIINILNSEKSFIESNRISSEIPPLLEKVTPSSLDKFIGFVNKHFDALVLKTIDEEFDSFSEINLENKEDRYFFARKFTIIGEFLKEFRENNNEFACLQGLRSISKIRDAFIHSSKFYFMPCKDVSLKDIKDNYYRIIHCFLNKDKTTLCDKEQLFFVNLLKKIKDPSGDNSKQVSKIDNEVEAKNIMVGLIRKSAQIIEQLKLKNISEGKKKSLTKELSALDQQYQTLKNYKPSEYPDSLTNPIEQGVIITVATESMRTADEVSDIKSMKKLICKAANFIEKLSKQDIKPKQKQSLEKKLSALDQQYQTLKNYKPSEYPDSLTNPIEQGAIISISEKIINESKAKKENQPSNETKIKTKILSYINIVCKEISYLKEVEKKLDIASDKKEYIIHQIISIIGQAMKDIKDNDSREHSILDNSSLLYSEASIVANKARSALGHDFFSVDPIKLATNVEDDILPAYNDVKSIFNIYEFYERKIDISFFTLTKIGNSFLSLGLYDEATKYLSQAIKYSEEHPEAISVMKMNSMGMEKGANSNTVFLDIDECFYKIEPCIFKLKSNYASACIKQGGKTKDAFRVLSSLVEQINTQDIEIYPPYLLTQFVNVFSNYAYCLHMIKNETSEAISYQDLSIMSSKLSGENFTYIYFNLAYYYKKIGNETEAIKVYEYLKQSNEPIMQFMASHSLSMIILQPLVIKNSSNHNDIIVNAETLVSNMDSILQRHSAIFKEKCGDGYYFYQLQTISMKINILLSKSTLDCTEKVLSDNLKEDLTSLEGEFKQVIDLFDQSKLYQTKMFDIYQNQIDAYTSILTLSNERACREGFNEEYNQILEHCLGKVNNYAFIINDRLDHTFLVSKESAGKLAKCYSNCTMYRDIVPKYFESNITLLKKALKIQETYELDRDVTLFNLGQQYYNLASDQSNRLSALENYFTSIHYISQCNEQTIDYFIKLGLSYKEIGILTSDSDYHSKALDCLLKAIDRKKILPKEFTDIADNLNDVACIYALLGNYDQAIIFIKKASEIDDRYEYRETITDLGFGVKKVENSHTYSDSRNEFNNANKILKLYGREKKLKICKSSEKDRNKAIKKLEKSLVIFKKLKLEDKVVENLELLKKITGSNIWKKQLIIKNLEISRCKQEIKEIKEKISAKRADNIDRADDNMMDDFLAKIDINILSSEIQISGAITETDGC